MIIFYNKNTGEIYGTIDGRVHTEEQLRATIRPSQVPESQIAKYVVSYKPVSKKVIRPITKMMLDPKTLEVKTVRVGEREVVEPDGFVMDDPLKGFFTKVEEGKERLYNHKFAVKGGRVMGTAKVKSMAPIAKEPPKRAPRVNEGDLRDKAVAEIKLSNRIKDRQSGIK